MRRRLLPRHVYEDVDRHGTPRTYAWLKGGRKIRIREPHGSVEFFAEIRGALEQLQRERDGVPRPIGRGPAAIIPGSMRALVAAYYTTAEFKRLDSRTQRDRRLALDRFCYEHGGKPAGGLEARHLKFIRDRMADRPAAANSLVKCLRQVFRATGDAEKNPAAKVPLLRVGGEGHHSWSPDEVARFEARHPVGTKPRLALALLLFTGQRRSDVVRLGRQFERDGGRLEFTQWKNRRRKPKAMWIPIVPELRRIIDATPSGHLTYLVTASGKPYSANGFSNWFRRQCDAAGLRHCSAHGLRKAAGARLAELGCTEHEIASILGHETLKEVSRYTAAARQKELAENAGRRLAEASSQALLKSEETSKQSVNESFPLPEQMQDGGKKTGSKVLKRKNRE